MQRCFLHNIKAKYNGRSAKTSVESSEIRRMGVQGVLVISHPRHLADIAIRHCHGYDSDTQKP